MRSAGQGVREATPWRRASVRSGAVKRRSAEPRRARNCAFRFYLKRRINCRGCWASIARLKVAANSSFSGTLYLSVRAVRDAVGGSNHTQPKQEVGRPLRSLVTISPLVPHIFLVAVHLRQEFSSAALSRSSVLTAAYCYDARVLKIYDFSSVLLPKSTLPAGDFIRLA